MKYIYKGGINKGSYIKDFVIGSTYIANNISDENNHFILYSLYSENNEFVTFIKYTDIEKYFEPIHERRIRIIKEL